VSSPSTESTGSARGRVIGIGGIPLPLAGDLLGRSPVATLRRPDDAPAAVAETQGVRAEACPLGDPTHVSGPSSPPGARRRPAPARGPPGSAGRAGAARTSPRKRGWSARTRPLNRALSPRGPA
jgi:hypothetical protein